MTTAAQDILVVEDEAAIREMVGYTLRRAGYVVRLAEDARGARQQLAEKMPDLVLVDWMLPDLSGLELTRALRASDVGSRKLPIIMLTARGEEADRVAGLNSGADDYVTKPFSTRELIARIQSVLRRSLPPTARSEERVQVGALELDTAAERITCSERIVALSPSEFRILAFLMVNAERAFSRDQLIERARSDGRDVGVRTVDVHIRRLRVLLEVFGVDSMIQTVRGVGYRLSASIEGVAP